MKASFAGLSVTIAGLVVLALTGCGGETGAKTKAKSERSPARKAERQKKAHPQARATKKKAAHRAAAKRKRAPRPVAFPAWMQGFKPTYTWTWRESAPDGSRYLTRLGVGKFTHLGRAPVLAGFTSTGQLASSCADFDSKTDAVAPAGISVTNETRGKQRTVETRLYTADPLGYYSRSAERPTKLSIAAGYVDGVQCYDITDALSILNGQGRGWTVKWNKRVRRGRSPGVSYAYLIIHGYFSRAHPAGDPAVLRNALLDVNGGSTYSPPRRLDSLKGPGVFRSPKGELMSIVPLGGKRSCRYTRTRINPVLVCGVP